MRERAGPATSLTNKNAKGGNQTLRKDTEGRNQENRANSARTKSAPLKSIDENSTKNKNSKKKADKTERRNPIENEEWDRIVKLGKKSAGEEDKTSFVEQLSRHAQMPSRSLLVDMEIWKMQDM